jgi:predicted negative regulator of RcsB-dependent stress response
VENMDGKFRNTLVYGTILGAGIWLGYQLGLDSNKPFANSASYETEDFKIQVSIKDDNIISNYGIEDFGTLVKATGLGVYGSLNAPEHKAIFDLIDLAATEAKIKILENDQKSLENKLPNDLPKVLPEGKKYNIEYKLD